MLDEVCRYLRNYFYKWPLSGNFVIKDGYIRYSSGESLDIPCKVYIRILHSFFNDGIHKYTEGPDDTLTDEVFKGTVWVLKIPPEVVEISDEIDKWKALYGTYDCAAMSPFDSENFDAYGYTKSKNTSNSSNLTGWQAAFEDRLSGWRKI